MVLGLQADYDLPGPVASDLAARAEGPNSNSHGTAESIDPPNEDNAEEAAEGTPLLRSRGRSQSHLKGSIAGVYSLAGGRGHPLVDKSWRAPVRQSLASSTIRDVICFQCLLISGWDCEWNISCLERQVRPSVGALGLRAHDGCHDRPLAAGPMILKPHRSALWVILSSALRYYSSYKPKMYTPSCCSRGYFSALEAQRHRQW